MERFYVAPEAMSEREALITEEEWKHLSNVLRLKAGDRVEVFDGKGRGYTGRLADLERSQARVALESPVQAARDSGLRICLGQAIPKGERMEWIVQKATELGVDAIQPLALSRCVVRLDGERKRRDRQGRWQKIALEAAKQCGRLTIPEVMYPLGLDEFLQRIRPQDLFLIPWEEGGQPLKAFFADTGDFASTGGTEQRGVVVMIGPEGGIEKEEMEACRYAGGRALTLGPRILRTDTAGLMILSVLQVQWGDMG